MINLHKYWNNTKYGEAPFREVKVISFSFASPKNKEETAFLQYNLLLNESILQLHLEHNTGKGIAIVIADFDLGSELKNAGLQAHGFSEKEITYEELLSRNNTF